MAAGLTRAEPYKFNIPHTNRIIRFSGLLPCSSIFFRLRKALWWAPIYFRNWKAENCYLDRILLSGIFLSYAAMLPIYSMFKSWNSVLILSDVSGW
ncbi:MAG TPA: hypothetical protein DDX68_09250 [Clostridium sp.]|uniref:Uncharacterized protein n=1 Tax=Lacrimispora celerecrescens TaxID=29354 RepID=A0A084JMF6_9FIRM|nr:hypothetical protein IO98_11705 [Lacrimispora celerecrescens]HBG11937.1 hypothetical protein [Clostridium sp.]